MCVGKRWWGLAVGRVAYGGATAHFLMVPPELPSVGVRSMVQVTEGPASPVISGAGAGGLVVLPKVVQPVATSGPAAKRGRRGPEGDLV